MRLALLLLLLAAASSRAEKFVNKAHQIGDEKSKVRNAEMDRLLALREKAAGAERTAIDERLRALDVTVNADETLDLSFLGNMRPRAALAGPEGQKLEQAASAWRLNADAAAARELLDFARNADPVLRAEALKGLDPFLGSDPFSKVAGTIVEEINRAAEEGRKSSDYTERTNAENLRISLSGWRMWDSPEAKKRQALKARLDWAGLAAPFVLAAAAVLLVCVHLSAFGGPGRMWLSRAEDGPLTAASALLATKPGNRVLALLAAGSAVAQVAAGVYAAATDGAVTLEGWWLAVLARSIFDWRGLLALVTAGLTLYASLAVRLRLLAPPSEARQESTLKAAAATLGAARFWLPFCLNRIAAEFAILGAFGARDALVLLYSSHGETTADARAKSERAIAADPLAGAAIRAADEALGAWRVRAAASAAFVMGFAGGLLAWQLAERLELGAFGGVFLAWILGANLSALVAALAWTAQLDAYAAAAAGIHLRARNDPAGAALAPR